MLNNRVMSKNTEPIIQPTRRPQGEKKRRPWGLVAWIIGILAIFITVPFFIFRSGNANYVLRSYETTTVQTGSLVDYVRGSGSVVPRLERPVLAPVEGTLAEWMVAEGDEVTQGDIIGTLSSKTLGRDIAQANSDLEAAQLALEKLRVQQSETSRQEGTKFSQDQAALQVAENDASVVQQLFDAGAASKNELAIAQQKLAVAREAVTSDSLSGENNNNTRTLEVSEANLKLESARNKLADLTEQQEQLTLTAPVTGRVMKLSVPLGQAVIAQALLATVASGQDVRVLAKIPEVQASRLSTGQIANLKVGNDSYQGSVVQVSPNAETSQAGPVVPVSLSFDEVPRNIRISASSAIEVEVDRKDEALLLNRGAYLSTGGERFVYIINGETATRTNVTFGLVDGDSVEVLEGLEPGDRIVTSSYEAFKDKTEIRLASQGEIK